MTPLKTFKVHLTVTVVGFCEANTDVIARSLITPLRKGLDEYCMGKMLSHGDIWIRAEHSDNAAVYSEVTV